MLVLIIDDNATNLKVYVNVVTHIPGISTQTFQSSAEGLAWCRDNEPDLLVLDYHMPTPNGIEFIQEYRRLRPTAQTPIVMITGEQDRELRRQALDIGASDFLSKPADPVEFLARVRNLLNIVESRRLLEKKSALVADASTSALHQASAHDVETINLLMRAVEYPENPSGMHVIRIGQYAALLARGIGRPMDEQRQMMLAAPLHDIGKCVVRDSVLLKNGPLTPAEWELVRQHPIAGHHLLENATVPVLKLGAEIALGHHERWNGDGYPNGLAGTAIPLAARIVAVADAFDAMLSDRPYRRALPHERAFEELRTHAGIFYDPVITAAAEASRDEMLGIASTFADDTVPA
jgi:two-component system, response regulator RpfG